MTVNAIERAKAHFKQLVDEPTAIRVPEWDDKQEGEFIIYSTPVTMEQRARLNRFSANTVEMTVELIIMKAKDKDGNPHFTKEHKKDLMCNVDADVLGRIAKKIIGASIDEMAEEAEKN